MALKLTREALEQKYTKSSSSSSQNSQGSNKTYQSVSHSIKSRFEGRESVFSNGWQAANGLAKYNSLFGRNIIDASGKVDALLENDDWRVDMDIDGDGIIDQGISIADAIAYSCDSELDLYIQSELEKVIEKYGPSCNYNMRALFGSPNSPALKELERLGIRADAVGDDEKWQNRTYAFSLVDTSAFGDENKARLNELASKNPKELTAEEKAELEDLEKELHDILYDKEGKILEDEFGGKGSFIFSDCLIPDGTANGAEINLASILDTLGYECISKADFVDDPDAYFELMDEIALQIEDGVYSPKDENKNNTITAIYGEKTLDISTAVRAVYTANGHAYGKQSDGYWGNNSALTFEENLARIEKCGLGSDGSGMISAVRIGNETIEINATKDGIEDTIKNLQKEEKEEKQDKETFIQNYVEQKCTEYKHNNFTDEVPEEKQQEFKRDAEIKATAKFA